MVIIMKSKTIVIICIVAVIYLIVIFLIFVPGEKDTTVTINQEFVAIESIYGAKFDVSNILEIKLHEKSFNEIVGDATRTRGYGGFGSTLKGSFSSAEYKNMLVYVKTKEVPTLQITLLDNTNIFISTQDKDKTTAICEAINIVLGGIL